MRHFLILLLFVFKINSALAVIAVIHGHESVPAGERGYARSLATHIERWYKGYGVACRVHDDREITVALSGTKLAVLVYLSQPDATRIAALRSYVNRGGKLIVFYSASHELAQLMMMKSVGYQGQRTDGRWSSMRFANAGIHGMPGMIEQSSSNLIGMAPITGKSRVIAWWHDRNGKRSDPAWLASANGYWMTHVLLADGDAEAKSRMLLALAASYDSSLWLAAAESVLADAAKVGNSGGSAGMLRLAAAVKHSDRRARALKAAQALVAEDQKTRASINAGQGWRAFQQAIETRLSTWNLYGIMQSPRSGEIRAVWDHSGMGLYPGNWKLTCELLQHAGITDIYVNVAGAGFAYYNSSVLPRSQLLLDYGDQLDACVKAARQHNLRVHAWILCFSTERATPTRIDTFKKQGWLITPPGNRAARWLDPAVADVRMYLVRAVQEMAVKYNIAGVHLDFVRYPDFDTSLGETSRRGFESYTGKRVVNWPADVKPGGVQHNRFATWRAQQVSQFVNAARSTIKRDAPGKILTAAVFGKYPSCFAAVGQDWVSWLDIGLVDYVTPMNYTADLSAFQSWVSEQTRTRDHRLRVLPGIGVTANESRLNAAQVIDQINVVRRANCPGFVLFDLDTTLRQEILPVMRMGVTAP